MSSHRTKARTRGWPPLEYNLTWLKSFAFDRGLQSMYATWALTGLKRDAPSIDRIDSNLPYTKTNIQLVTFGENHDKARKEMAVKPVEQYTEDLELIASFPSVTEAAAHLGVSRTSLAAAARKVFGRYKGYRWSYL